MEDFNELIRQAQIGDINIKNKLIEMNLPLVTSIAKTFINRGYEFDDLFQIGSIGLIKAIDKFNTNFDVKFSTYAVPLIQGEIKRFIRDDGLIKISRETKLISQKLYFKQIELENKLNRESTIEELADYTGYSVDIITKTLKATASISSLSQIIHESESNDLTLQSDFNLEEEVEKNIDIFLLKKCMNKLPKNQKSVMLLRLKEKTQVEIAKLINTSQVQVSRLEKKAIKNIKELMKGAYNNMTNKEKAFKMFAKGKLNKDVAEKLDLSIRTVESYKSNYNKKNGLSNKNKFNKKNKSLALDLFKQGFNKEQVAKELNITIDLADYWSKTYNSKNEEDISMNENKINKSDTARVENLPIIDDKSIDNNNSSYINLAINNMDKENINKMVNILVGNLKEGQYNISFVVK
ncbi:sigma-70 family RNA polymerase sigma factor [Clostridium botulinum]|uniref:RNA polymerase sigma factor SigS n=1 Tax=Clostridium sporogenes TaxID=1509 RepID=A0A1L3NEB5_CLOSG|nr:MULTISPECIES: sigma-70 family RNA polymerase sigma factor [Clostridium]APH14479.1 RNA polymerase sigma factor domain protein [Clostridium sporogenes]MBD5640487.1 sigma-70 family RNA polymerase sigma factor [Clostridium botulinum]MDI6919082.1 sigma-70 family RNA polymerase sigma factor [Clostridium botulinum]WMU99701.1 sigma-70 family RNA polymerase sigma factor [Clostridium botulinum]